MSPLTEEVDTPSAIDSADSSSQSTSSTINESDNPELGTPLFMDVDLTEIADISDENTQSETDLEQTDEPLNNLLDCIKR